jgi:SAM-dependent methyltransferase
VGEPDVRRFVEHGRDVATAVVQAADAAGSCVPDADAILDFGCGCGRIVQPMLHLAAARTLTGTDVDAEAIAWLAEAHGDRAEFVVNEFSPPLRFDDGRFDLLYTVSILTHFDEPMQDRWLAEIARVLRPGGVALISLHGEHAYDVVRAGRQSAVSADQLERLRRHGSLGDEGFIFEPYEHRSANRGQFPGIAGAYGLTFQSSERVASRWVDRFDVIDHRPLAVNNWQDLVVVRRR